MNECKSTLSCGLIFRGFHALEVEFFQPNLLHLRPGCHYTPAGCHGFAYKIVQHCLIYFTYKYWCYKVKYIHEWIWLQTQNEKDITLVFTKKRKMIMKGNLNLVWTNQERAWLSARKKFKGGGGALFKNSGGLPPCKNFPFSCSNC